MGVPVPAHIESQTIGEHGRARASLARHVVCMSFSDQMFGVATISATSTLRFAKMRCFKLSKKRCLFISAIFILDAKQLVPVYAFIVDHVEFAESVLIIGH